VATEVSDSRRNVLSAAEAEFARRGFASTRLKDVADRLGVKQAALYYHAPGGKQDLYVAVLRTSMERHRAGVLAALGVDGDLATKLRALGHWFQSQPPIDLVRIARADLPELDASTAAELLRDAATVFQEPIAQALTDAIQSGEVRPIDVKLASSIVLTTFDALHGYPSAKGVDPETVIAGAVDLLVTGLANPHKRSPPASRDRPDRPDQLSSGLRPAS
jgi:AcrR family transcriptional regulator